MKKVCLSIIICLIPLAFTGCGKTKVELNKYVHISAEGYDTVGKAAVTFDEKAFEDDYYGKIKGPDDESADTKVFWRDCIGGAFDKAEELSNGDNINWRWDCKDAKAEADYDVTLDYSDIPYAVSSLTPLKAFDPFEHYYVYFIDDGGEVATLKMEKGETEEFRYIEFIYDGTGFPKWGDTIIVKADIPEDLKTEFTKRFGEYLEVTEKEYVVEAK